VVVEEALEVKPEQETDMEAEEEVLLQYQEDFILQIYYPIFYTFKSVKEVVEVHLAVVEVLDNYLMFAQDQTHYQLTPF
jgi:hypothetical protein